MYGHNVTTFGTRTLTWLITGASSGMGRALTHLAASRGDNVIAVSRTATADVDHLPGAGAVLAVAADVRDEGAVKDAVHAGVTEFGRIDVVANLAGFGVFGAVEEVTDTQARAIFDTNLFGALNVLRAVLPILRAQRAGHVIQGSSYYGQTAHSGVGLLAATKFALGGLSDALAEELQPLDIKVTTLEPGPTATAFLSNLEFAATSIQDYDQTVRATLRGLEALPPTAFDSAGDVAQAVLTAVLSATPPRRLATGAGAVTAIRETLLTRTAELEAWVPVSIFETQGELRNP